MSRLLSQVSWVLLTACAAFAQPVALSLNTASREEIRQAYHAIYSASENVPIAWTGNYGSGNAGDTSAAFKEATRLRVNFFRALVGVPAGIVFDATYSQKAQQGAFMQSVNAFTGSEIVLNHVPPASWRFYTAAGAEASESSNLSFRTVGPEAINSYVADHGDNNRAVGHRRWLFVPQTRLMGTGDVPGDGSLERAAANALWIKDTTPPGTLTSPRPATRTTHVSYPPAGYVPFQLVWPRWSLSYPGADFSTTTITMTRAGQSIPVTLEPLANAAVTGEPTIVWVYNNLDSTVDAPHVRPAADTTYTVTATGVRVGATMLPPIVYNVTVFDPDVRTADSTPTAVSGSASPAVGAANAYAVAKPAFAAGFDWRTLRLSPYTRTYNAETGVDDLLATTSSGYSIVQTAFKAGGNAAFYLAHPDPRAHQILQIPDTLFVGSTNAALTFASRLGFATANQVARVQVSTDDNVSWLDVFTQAGTTTSTPPNLPTETAFTTRRVSLAAFAGRTLRLRFIYTVPPGGSAFPQTNPAQEVGWFIDNIALSDVQTVTADAPVRVASGATFSYQPAAAGSVALQARGVLFGAYPIEWGPALPVVALDANANNNPGRLINMSIRTNAGTGDNTLIVGIGLGGAGTSGDKAVLLRAVGPTLGAFGVGGALLDPVMTVFQGTAQVAQNDDWDLATGANFGPLGAFPITHPSRDSAIYGPAIVPASYSIQIVGKNNATGVALAEIYDATPSASFTASTPRLVNVAARTSVGTGDNILIAGFVVGGSTPVRVLVRAVGPTLGAFGVGGVLADPRLTISTSTATVAENDNWGGAPALKAAFGPVGAFAFADDNSRDAAVLVTLQPGSYTAQVSGVGNTTGVALVEVYEVP